MDVRDFCNSMGTELSGWKAKAYDFLSFVNSLPEEERERVAPKVQGLSALISGIEGKLNELATFCPADFTEVAEKIRSEVAMLQEKMGEIWDKDHIAGGYVGG